MDSGYASALAALAGSSIGALASFATTWLNQSYQNRIQRHSNERARREKLFGDFINEAAAAYTDAMVNKLENPSGLVNLYAIKSRISLFSNEEVLLEADKVMQAITSKYYGEKTKYSEMNPDTVTQFDLLRDFTRSCRKEMTKY
jgi:ferredoxin-NADP reductase